MSKYNLEDEKKHMISKSEFDLQTPELDNAMNHRLIEKYFPSKTLSEKSSVERYSGGKTPHTIFTWWARRPFAAMRGIIEASIAQCSKQLTLNGLSTPNRSILSKSLWSEEIEHPIEPEPQRILDIFAGGATIPLVAASLGTQAYALDNNELAHFIQITLLRLSQVSPKLPKLVEEHGKTLLKQLINETAGFYPNRNTTEGARIISYFWSRSVKCPVCQASLSLLKRPWFSKKKGRTLFLERTPDFDNKSFTLRLSTSGSPQDTASAWIRNIIKCPFCGHIIDRDNIDAVLSEYAYDELTAYCTSQGHGKSFAICEDQNRLIPSEDWLKEQISADIAALNRALPESELPRWSGITNPTLYGIHKISDLFNIRQLAVLVRVCRLLHDEYVKCCDLYGTEVAVAIIAFLSGLIDQLVDWNGRLCMWISQNEQVGRGYSGPGIPMMWDFVEIDPVGNGPANLWDKLERIVAGMKSIPKFQHLPEVYKGDARNLPFLDQYFDVVVTDPPYFDNLYYNILADCIYVWKRLALADILPEVFSRQTTNMDRELSVSKYRHDTFVNATKFYTDGMARALFEVRRVLKSEGVLAFVFAHSSVEGWASIVEAFRRASIDMVAAWEMQVERKHRPRGMQSDAVNTSFVLVGKKHFGQWKELKWEDFISILSARLSIEYKRLTVTGWSSLDVGLSLFGIAVCAYAQEGDVIENEKVLSSQEALERIAKHIEAMLPGFAISHR